MLTDSEYASTIGSDLAYTEYSKGFQKDSRYNAATATFNLEQILVLLPRSLHDTCREAYRMELTRLSESADADNDNV